MLTREQVLEKANCVRTYLSSDLSATYLDTIIKTDAALREALAAEQQGRESDGIDFAQQFQLREQEHALELAQASEARDQLSQALHVRDTQLAKMTAERDEWAGKWDVAHKVKDQQLNALLARCATLEAACSGLTIWGRNGLASLETNQALDGPTALKHLQNLIPIIGQIEAALKP
jgi:hypothetical protein